MSDSGTTIDKIEETFFMHNGRILSHTISKEQKRRIVKGILSGEVVDKDGDLIPIEEFAKFFEILIRRQTPILLKHQPIHVGNLISLEKITYNRIPAVLVEYEILSDFAKDDETWEGIIQGKLFGMSFTGEVEQTIVKCDGNKCHKERKLSAIYEITVTDRPANQVSSAITEYLTKEYNKELIVKEEAERMSEENTGKEGEQTTPTLSKEELQKELKTLGEGITLSIKESITEGFKELAKVLNKEEAEPENPPAEEAGKEDETTSKEFNPEEERIKLKAELTKELTEEIQKEIKKGIEAQTSSVGTPLGSNPSTITKSKDLASVGGSLISGEELLARIRGGK